MRILKFHLFLSLILILGLNVSDAIAQSKSAPKDKSDQISPIGFGLNVGNIGFYNDALSIGLSPNIAYRFAENMALGFMMKLEYNYERYQTVSGNLKFSSFDLGPTIFARYKPLWYTTGLTPFLQGLFIQAEYERAFFARPKRDEFGNYILEGNRFVAERPGEDYAYIGLGASFGYPLSTFLSLHYNILDMGTSTRIPIDYRFGITYRY